MRRLDPNDVLARYHARHQVPHLTCPVCMRRPLAAIPRRRAGR